MPDDGGGDFDLVVALHRPRTLAGHLVAERVDEDICNLLPALQDRLDVPGEGLRLPGKAR